MSGAFDLTNFLGGYYDQDCLLQPADALPAEPQRPLVFERYRRNTYVLGTGWDDQCLGQNQDLDRIMSSQGHPAQAVHMGDMELARLADLAEDDAGISVTATRRSNRYERTESL